MDIFSAIILGIIEGLTEFLPVSSTGHMILGAHLLGLSHEGNDTLKCFEVAIQLGSILAVAAMFFKRLIAEPSLIIKLISVVAYALIIGGVVFIAVELLMRRKNPEKISFEAGSHDEIAKISYKQAFIIGLAQCLAMIPGTSRSGSTIVAGLLCGLSRTGAAAFSFLLALPTMFAATFYDVFKNRELFISNADNIYLFLLGAAVAFVVALFVLRAFLSFVSKFSYISFGVYRIIIGAVFLLFVL